MNMYSMTLKNVTPSKDGWNKIMKLGLEKKGYKKIPFIYNSDGKQYLPEYKIHNLMLFQNEQYAELYNGFSKKRYKEKNLIQKFFQGK